MSKPILPDHLRKKIIDLFEQGFSSVEIYDEVYEEAMPYVESEEQYGRCISSIKGKVTLKQKAKITPVKKQKIPCRKKFDIKQDPDITAQLSGTLTGRQIEKLCEPVAIDILKNFEGFKKIESSNNVSGFHNPPFDFFAFKKGKPFIIEFKGSLNTFNSPGETQKRRMKEVLGLIDGLNIALLQVIINTGEYRIFYNDEMDLFFDGKKISVKPVVDWIKSKLTKE